MILRRLETLEELRGGSLRWTVGFVRRRLSAALGDVEKRLDVILEKDLPAYNASWLG